MVNSDGSSPTVTNCAFSRNAATSGSGGGMYNLAVSSPTLTNCTFSGNSAPSGSGGGMFNSNISSPTVTNCILWGNTPNNFAGAGSPVVKFSDVQGGFPGTGNIDAEPLFIDADGLDDIPGTLDDDLRLSSGSPCIDAATNWGVTHDTAPLDHAG